MARYLLICIVNVLLLSSCIQPPDYSEIPTLVYDSVSSTMIIADDDSLTLYFSFTDGDGDLGAVDNNPNTFLTDSRTGFALPYTIPNITPDGNVKDISGQIIISIPGDGIGCIPNHLLDTLNYEIYIVDRAGNHSNNITTDDIALDCQ